MPSLTIPTAYADGYRKARPHDPVAVDNYLRHTGIGDPELDPIMEELSDMPPAELHRFIGAGIEGHDHVLRAATLFQYRTKQRVLRRLAGTQRVRAHNFTQLLQISVYDDEGLSYRMPDHVHTAKSSSW